MMAVKQNNEKMVKVLLDAGADCSKQTILGEKVSDLATLNGFTEVCIQVFGSQLPVNFLL